MESIFLYIAKIQNVKYFKSFSRYI